MKQHISPNQKHQSISEIQKLYTHFLLDMWGVVHDGCTALPGAVDCLESLRSHDKKILFISNSSRPGNSLEELMNTMGIHRDTHYDHIYSSGDAVIDGINHQDNNLCGKNYYYLGDNPDHPMMRQIQGQEVTSIDDADYIMLTALTPTTDMVLERALSLKKTLVCANPDVVAIHGGQTGYCPGLAAQKYEKQGGYVIYYGKPYPPIYKSALAKMGNPPQQKIIAVGDGMHTDIQGANTMNLDSVLIHSGIHHRYSRETLESELEMKGLLPTFIMDRFTW